MRPATAIIANNDTRRSAYAVIITRDASNGTGNSAGAVIRGNFGEFDDPVTFSWGSSRWNWPTHLGTTGPHVVDRAPNGPVFTCPGQPFNPAAFQSTERQILAGPGLRRRAKNHRRDRRART